MPKRKIAKERAPGSRPGHLPVTTPSFSAGTAAGQRWAKALRNRARLVRLRDCRFDYRDRSGIYACYLTDRFMVAGPEEGCPQQYCIPINKAERLSEGYWSRIKGWPRRDAKQQTRFVEGFVRGAAGLAKVVGRRSHRPYPPRLRS
jgi:hypothetical protein